MNWRDDAEFMIKVSELLIPMSEITEKMLATELESVAASDKKLFIEWDKKMNTVYELYLALKEY